MSFEVKLFTCYLSTPLPVRCLTGSGGASDQSLFMLTNDSSLNGHRVIGQITIIVFLEEINGIFVECRQGGRIMNSPATVKNSRLISKCAPSAVPMAGKTERLSKLAK